MTRDERHDDPTVTRLRQALDELTAGLPTHHRESARDVDTIRGPAFDHQRRRWITPVLAGAAATAILAVGIVTLTRDTVTAPEPADDPTLPTTLPNTLPPPTTAPGTTVPEGNLVTPLPRHELSIQAELVSEVPTTPTDLIGAAWIQPESGNILLLQVRPGDATGAGPLGVEGARPDDTFPTDRGRAWVRGPNTLTPVFGPSWLWWERPDGDLWMLTMHWGDGAPDIVVDPLLTLHDWAFSIEPGSGLPYILPDDSWDVLSTQPPGARDALSTVWRVDGHEVLLFSIADSAVSGLWNLTESRRLSRLPVAGTIGWAVQATSGEGFSAIGWITPGTTVWNVLSIPPALTSRAAEIFGAIRLREAGVLPDYRLNVTDVLSTESTEGIRSTTDRYYWVHPDGPQLGLLRVVRVDGGGRTPEGDYELVELQGDWIGPDGRAWLMREHGLPDNPPKELFWDRGDEAVLLGAFMLRPDDLPLAAQQLGDGTPFAIQLPPTELREGRNLESVGGETHRGAFTSVRWTLDQGTVTVDVYLDGAQAALDLAWAARSIGVVTVAGRMGYEATLYNDQTVVWWPTEGDGGSGRTPWGVLNIAPELRSRASEIIAAIERVT